MAKKKSAGYRFGSHMSIAGGYYRAVEAAAEIGCDCVQLFTKNSNQWNAKPISQDEVERFTEALSSLGIVAPLSHASYLINLASPDDALWEKSIAAMVIEWQRAEQLGLDGVVVHPGAFVSSSESQGLDRIAQALQRIASDVMPAHSWLLLENTAGQGSCLGRTMEQLGWLIARTGRSMHVGVCIDTCHAHAAGYDMSQPEGLEELASQIDQWTESGVVRAVHLNDSKKGCGSRVDRHEHIGHGTIGVEGFERFLHHPLFRDLPMYLETEKGPAEDGRDWDIVNLETLRRCAGQGP
jgi:deoxyribonuclease-4